MPIMVGAGMTAQVLADVSGTVFGGAASWTDLSSYTDFSSTPITVTWGRNDQSSDVSPSVGARAFLDLHRDSRFTPNASAGVYYPYWRRRVHGQVRVSLAGTTVYLVDDYADSLTVVPSRDVPWTCGWSGTDILGRYGGTPSSNDSGAGIVGTSLRSFLAEEMLLASWSALYLMQEPDGSTSFGDATGQSQPMRLAVNGGQIDAGQSPSGNWTAGSMVSFTDPAHLTIPVLPWSGTTGTLGMWINTMTAYPTGYAAAYQIVGVPAASPSTGAPFWQLLYTNTGAIRFTTGVTGIVTYTVTSPSTYLDGAAHQVFVTCDGTNIYLYIDGALVAQTTGTVSATTSSPTLKFTTGSVGYLAFTTTAVSGANIQNYYQAGAFAFAGERTDTRITRLLSYRPDTGSVLDTGLGFMGEQDIGGESMQQALFDVGNVEGGVVFIDGQGRVNLRSRSRLFNPTPVLTLDCHTGCVDWPSQFREDTQNVLNDLTVTRNGGSDQRFVNAASVNGTDGEFSNTITLDIDTDANAMNMAGWAVAQGIQPQVTVTPLQVDLLQLAQSNPSLTVQVLQLRPMDCIEVTNCPAAAPATTMFFIVQGGEITLAVNQAQAMLNTAPLPPAVAVWDTTLWDSTAAVWAP